MFSVQSLNFKTAYIAPELYPTILLSQRGFQYFTRLAVQVKAPVNFRWETALYLTLNELKHRINWFE